MSGEKIPKPNSRKYLFEFGDEQQIKKFGKKFVRFWVIERATSYKDFFKFITKHWAEARTYFGNQNTRERSPQYPDLVEEIFKLNDLKTEALYRLAKIKKTKEVHFYRYVLIAKILRLRGKNSDERVRKILIKYKNKFRER